MGLIPPQIGEGPRWAYTAADRRRPQKGNAASEKRAPQMGLIPPQIGEGRRTASIAANQRVPQNGTFSDKILKAI